jgi:hypothetical protein
MNEKFHPIEKSYVNLLLKPFLVAEGTGTGIITH